MRSASSGMNRFDICSPAMLKVLLGGGRNHTELCKGRVNRGKDLMLALPDKVGVNLVTENRDMVLLADAAERQQLLAAPDTANRVVGAAQQEQLDLIIDNFSLKISIINLIAAVSVLLQITGNQPAAIVQHHLAEWVVDRLLNQHCIAGLAVICLVFISMRVPSMSKNAILIRFIGRSFYIGREI